LSHDGLLKESGKFDMLVTVFKDDIPSFARNVALGGHGGDSDRGGKLIVGGHARALALEATMKRIIESQDKVRTTGAEEAPEGARNVTLHFRLAIRAGGGFSF
jgi:hypothetical protein